FPGWGADPPVACTKMYRWSDRAAVEIRSVSAFTSGKAAFSKSLTISSPRISLPQSVSEDVCTFHEFTATVVVVPNLKGKRTPALHDYEPVDFTPFSRDGVFACFPSCVEIRFSSCLNRLGYGIHLALNTGEIGDPAVCRTLSYLIGKVEPRHTLSPSNKRHP